MSVDTETTPETVKGEVVHDEPGMTLDERLAQFGRMLAGESEFKKAVAQERAALLEALLEAQKTMPTKQFTHAYAGAKNAVTFTLKDPAEGKFTVADPDAFVAWAQENAPTEVDIQVVVKTQFTSLLLERLAVTDNGIVDTETGLIVEGVKHVPGGTVSTSFGTSWKGDGKSVAFTEAMAGDILAIGGSDGE